MTHEQKIQQQLDEGLAFVAIPSNVFCEVAAKQSLSVNSKDDAERSAALTLKAFTGKRAVMLQVAAAVAKKLLEVYLAKQSEPKQAAVKKADEPKS